MRHVLRLLLTLPFALLSVSAFTHSYANSKLSIDHPWARPTLAVTGTGAVYMNIDNPSEHEERLMTATVADSLAETVQIHQTLIQDDMALMREAREGLIIPAKGNLHLSPGGAHIMLIGLKTPLKEGDTFPLTLHFAHSGQLEVQVKVEDNPGASTMQHHHHH
ncbi:copper chaperone PCu(A)C [Bowmanella yangjiangensis]|uniref:Copper chaperone PCu(A)C n=1 Tax=Bowmanella yangjiangensis TaxID=2811230 RepID=A0ABS3CWM4_9ALTE|nr:copper chaperone PCu(A)C [Bowmanella yangjiangensis]MBN7821527.1 copper chaperone PCu(A)C [Bowmanella yangjiangensis]